MIMTGLARLGRDMEVRYTSDGTPVGNLALAFNYGKKGQDGNRPTQWVEASLWGDRADKLVQYLTKGTQLSVILSDVHIETFERRDGAQSSKLSARVVDLEFASAPAGGGQRQESRRDPEPRREPEQNPQRQAQHPADMDSDIPF